VVDVDQGVDGPGDGVVVVVGGGVVVVGSVVVVAVVVVVVVSVGGESSVGVVVADAVVVVAGGRTVGSVWVAVRPGSAAGVVVVVGEVVVVLGAAAVVVGDGVTAATSVFAGAAFFGFVTGFVACLSVRFVWCRVWCVTAAAGGCGFWASAVDEVWLT
jgi:hypothetical protein